MNSIYFKIPFRKDDNHLYSEKNKDERSLFQNSQIEGKHCRIYYFSRTRGVMLIDSLYIIIN